ncbi:MAG TPA: hypothetical protein VL625_11685 [Patescibacteria group bacterium]|nr:hypothetical protein [Patescibacteria group bacterium]
MSREQAEEILKRDMPQDTRVSIDVDESGYGNIAIKSEDIDESRTFNLDEHLLNSGFMELSRDGAKGKGLGRHIMRNEIEFFRACGVKRFHIYAALSNGGYTWARLGFLPENTIEFRNMKDKVRARLEILAPVLVEDEKKELEDIAQFNSAKDIWRLADSKIDLRQRLIDCFTKAADGDISARRLKSDLIEMHDDIVQLTRSKKDLLIGRVLLTGTSWYGNIDFDNAEQMARVEKYVGGWIGMPATRKPPEATNDNDPQLSAKPEDQLKQADKDVLARPPPSLFDRIMMRLGL